VNGNSGKMPLLRGCVG